LPAEQASEQADNSSLIDSLRRIAYYLYRESFFDYENGKQIQEHRG